MRRHALKAVTLVTSVTLAAFCPARAEMPAECKPTYLAGVLSGIEQHCRGMFRVTPKGHAMETTLLGEGSKSSQNCIIHATAKMALDFNESARAALQFKLTPDEMWCGAAALMFAQDPDLVIIDGQ